MRVEEISCYTILVPFVFFVHSSSSTLTQTKGNKVPVCARIDIIHHVKHSAISHGISSIGVTCGLKSIRTERSKNIGCPKKIVFLLAFIIFFLFYLWWFIVRSPINRLMESLGKKRAIATKNNNIKNQSYLIDFTFDAIKIWLMMLFIFQEVNDFLILGSSLLLYRRTEEKVSFGTFIILTNSNWYWNCVLEFCIFVCELQNIY